MLLLPNSSLPVILHFYLIGLISQHSMPKWPFFYYCQAFLFNILFNGCLAVFFFWTVCRLMNSFLFSWVKQWHTHVLCSRSVSCLFNTSPCITLERDISRLVFFLGQYQWSIWFCFSLLNYLIEWTRRLERCTNEKNLSTDRKSECYAVIC